MDGRFLQNHERRKLYSKQRCHARLSHFILDDSNDFSWSSAKACHAVLLCHMEQGEIKDYTQTDLIDRVRRAHAQRHAPPSQNVFKKPTKNFPGRDKNVRSMICQFLTKELAFTKLLMKPKVSPTNMYVTTALQNMGRLFLILKLIARQNLKVPVQKTNKLGRLSCFLTLSEGQNILEFQKYSF